ncbi:MAG: presenilin family intramembrane aspartyl protease PSH [Halobacteriaceae archaeon]
MSETVDEGVGASSAEGPLLPDIVPPATTYLLALVAIAIGVLFGPEVAGTPLQMENPGSPASLIPIVIGLTVGTVAVLLVVRYGAGELLLRLGFVGLFAYLPALAVATVIGVLPAIALGLALFGTLWVHPEWYVVNVTGVAYVGVANAILGVSLEPWLIVATLGGMAIYDAYSVYVSEHMQSLVEGASIMDLPMAFVVPRRLGFSLRDGQSLLDIDEDVSVLGFGDAFFPGILAVSAGHFVAAPTVVSWIPLANLPALGTLVGAVIGMVGIHVLGRLVPRSHPALIVLNPAVILGFLGGAMAAGVPLASALGF